MINFITREALRCLIYLKPVSCLFVVLKCCSFACVCYQGLRGCGADVIILEEAAHMNPDVFFQVVVPLLTVRHTAVLAISTPDDEFNYYTELLECGLFHTIKVGLICDPCMAKGIPCNHMKKKLPSWKSAENHDKVLKIMKTQKTLAMREIGGEVITDRQFIFRKHIQDLHTSPRHNFTYAPQVIHCVIDPSGGGKGSDWAIMSGCIDNGMRVVSAGAACKLASQTILYSHIRFESWIQIQ